MKILQIDAYHHILGGAEKVMFNTAELLKEHGHDVVFFSLCWDENFDSEYSSYFAPSRESRTGLLRPLKNVASYFYHTEAAKKIGQLIEVEHPDIAQIHLMWGNISPSILDVLKKHNVPVIMTVHDYRMVCPAYVFKNGKGNICEECDGHKFWKCITNKCCKDSYSMSLMMTAEIYFRNKVLHAPEKIDGFLFVSNFAKEKHEPYMPFLKDRKTVVMYNFSEGIDAERNIPSGEKYILYFGRLSKEKGVHTLLNAVKDLNNVQLKIVGTGSEEVLLKNFVAENNIKNVEFLGYKQGDELKSLVKNAYFIIVPSEWYENNPMTIIEAYSASTPVIGSRIGGIPEIIVDGETGFSFKWGDVAELRSVISKADALSRDEYLQMRRKALDFAHKHFDREDYYNRLINFYKEFL